MSYRSVPAWFLGLGLIAGSAHADFLEIRVGAGGWNPSFSGDVVSGGDDVDLESDLGLDDESQIRAYVQIEHAIPLVPSARLEYNEMQTEARGRVTTTFDGVNFTGDVDSDFDLSHTDLVFYWELLDNVVSLDIGGRIKYVEGELVIRDRTGSGQVSRTDIEEAIPMLYTNIGFDLPVTGLGVRANLAGISGFGDNRIIDANADVHYDLDHFGFELGWRHMAFKLDDQGDIDADIRVSGPFLGVNVHF